jgi:CubicO group peptidase (beta-lactamase class C family)
MALAGFGIPRDAYYMAGAGGQTTVIIPSHDLVVVRLGHYRGEPYAASGFSEALALLIEAVPKAENARAQEFEHGSAQPAKRGK